MNHNNLVGRYIHSGDVVDWEFLSNKGLAQSFFNSINTDPFSGPQWVNLFQINEPIFCDLVSEFFASFEFDSNPCRYNVGNTKAKSIRNLRIRLAHRYITITITGRKETTHCVTEIDLFYLYCIFGEGIIAWSFGLLTEEIVSVLSREPPPHVYRKTSLIKMGVIMELHKGECCWLATREVVGEGEGDEEGGNEGVGGSIDVYRDMSTGE
ncbi:hypothetical protein Tco_0213206 [Tanacetum coccineum]